jgi:hypothetical protein
VTPEPKPRHRWYQFSLRTFFVLVTLVCVGFGYWVHWSREWIRLRHEWMISKPGFFIGNDYGAPNPSAPGGLWLLGEEGANRIYVAKSDVQEAMRLFPEAAVSVIEYNSIREPIDLSNAQPVPLPEHLPSPKSD